MTKLFKILSNRVVKLVGAVVGAFALAVGFAENLVKVKTWLSTPKPNIAFYKKDATAVFYSYFSNNKVEEFSYDARVNQMILHGFYEDCLKQTNILSSAGLKQEGFLALRRMKDTTFDIYKNTRVKVTAKIALINNGDVPTTIIDGKATLLYGRTNSFLIDVSPVARLNAPVQKLEPNENLVADVSLETVPEIHDWIEKAADTYIRKQGFEPWKEDAFGRISLLSPESFFIQVVAVDHLGNSYTNKLQLSYDDFSKKQ